MRGATDIFGFINMPEIFVNSCAKAIANRWLKIGCHIRLRSRVLCQRYICGQHCYRVSHIRRGRKWNRQSGHGSSILSGRLMRTPYCGQYYRRSVDQLFVAATTRLKANMQTIMLAQYLTCATPTSSSEFACNGRWHHPNDSCLLLFKAEYIRNLTGSCYSSRYTPRESSLHRQ